MGLSQSLDMFQMRGDFIITNVDNINFDSDHNTNVKIPYNIPKYEKQKL